MFTHGPEQGLLCTSGFFKKSLSIIWFEGKKSWIFHEAPLVTITSSRFAKLLQAFEESADCALLIAVARGAMVSLRSSGISFHFVLRKDKPNTVPRLKSKYLAPPKISGRLRRLLCFLHLQMINTCTYLYSSNYSSQTRYKWICPISFIRNRFHVSVVSHYTYSFLKTASNAYGWKIERLKQEQRMQTNSRIKLRSINPNISWSHYTTEKYVVSE